MIVFKLYNFIFFQLFQQFGNCFFGSIQVIGNFLVCGIECLVVVGFGFLFQVVYEVFIYFFESDVINGVYQFQYMVIVRSYYEVFLVWIMVYLFIYKVGGDVNESCVFFCYSLDFIFFVYQVVGKGYGVGFFGFQIIQE